METSPSEADLVDGLEIFYSSSSSSSSFYVGFGEVPPLPQGLLVPATFAPGLRADQDHHFQIL